MHSRSFRRRLWDATSSTTHYGVYEASKFSSPGPFQTRSGWAIFAMLVLLVIGFAFFEGAIARAAALLAGVTSFIGLGLLLYVHPLVKEGNAWELGRWINRHQWMYMVSGTTSALLWIVKGV